MVDVWVQHEQAVDLFIHMGTQWRVGFGGAIGLDYGVLFQLMDVYPIAQAQRQTILEQIQVMEQAALAVMYEHQS